MSTGAVIEESALTPWFDGDVMPVRDGLYQVQCLNHSARFNTAARGDGMRYFDGTHWRWTEDGRPSNFGEMSKFKDQWRGLAADPAGGAK